MQVRRNKATFLKYRRENKQFFTYQNEGDIYIFRTSKNSKKNPNQQNYITKNAREYPAGRRKIIPVGKTFLLFKSL